MTRTIARRLALQLSFAMSAGSDMGPEEFFNEEYYRSLPRDGGLFEEEPGEAQKQYICALVRGVQERREELDSYVSRYSRGWKLSRLSRTALAVLRVALYEILYMPDIPAAASINEAVDLAKIYDTPETVRYVNGILGSFMRDWEENAGEKPEAVPEEPVPETAEKSPEGSMPETSAVENEAAPSEETAAEAVQD